MKRSAATGRIVIIVVGLALLVLLLRRERPYLTSAMKVANWLQSTAIEKEGGGKAWPADPKDPASVSPNLYHGTAGAVLFFLELYRSTNRQTFLDEALAAAEYIISTLPETLGNPEEASLYTGVAGEGFVLEEAYNASKKPKYREAALRCVQLVHKSAKSAGAGVEWGDTTDIIRGGAGIGLFLLYAARKMDHPASRELAIQAGRRLLELGIPEKGGLKWQMEPGYPRLMPNFSHGTAGVSYFLASLYGETKEKGFLEGALAGAAYLLNITNPQGLIFHHEPEGEDLFYLGWCHGPPGTARLYYRLWKETGDEKWLKALHRTAKGVMESGIPEKRTPGFWNNAGQCCGDAGVAEFFLSLFLATGKQEYLDFSKRVTAHLLTRASREGEGLKWIQAEHRVKPDLLAAQTGFMQGASGIGILLLHLDAFEEGLKPGIALPDSPF